MLAKNILVGPRHAIKEHVEQTKMTYRLYQMEKSYRALAQARQMEMVQAELDREAYLNRIIFDYV
jgi:hypothetical protein